MITPQLLEFIAAHRAVGQSDEQIKSALISAGWMESVVLEALAPQAAPIAIPAPVPELEIPAATPPALLKIGELFTEAFGLFRKRVWVLIGIMIVPTILTVLLSIGMFFVSAVLPLLLMSIAYGGFSPAVILTSGGVLLLVFLVVMLQIWSYTATIVAIGAPDPGIGVFTAYRQSFKMILSYLWIGILTTVIVWGGTIFLIIPGILFAMWFSLAPFVRGLEGEKGLRALLLSREYVRGHVWSLIIRLVLCFAVIFLVLGISTFLFAILNIPLVTFIVSVAVSLVVGPFALSYIYTIYRNFKALRGTFAFAPTGKQKSVFVLVGVLGMLIIPAIMALTVLGGGNSARAKSRDARRLSDISNTQTVLEMYFDAETRYPTTLSELIPKYIQQVPVDPETGAQYSYILNSNGNYHLCGKTEGQGIYCVDGNSTGTVQPPQGVASSTGEVVAPQGASVQQVAPVVVQPERTTAGQGVASQRDAARQDNIDLISVMLDDYYARLGHYPVSLAELATQNRVTVPKDPLTNTQYVYQLFASGAFQVCANLELGTKYCSTKAPPAAKPAFVQPAPLSSLTPVIQSVGNDATPNVNISINGLHFDAYANMVTLNGITKVLPASPPNAAYIAFQATDFGITAVGYYTFKVATANGVSEIFTGRISKAPTK